HARTASEQRAECAEKRLETIDRALGMALLKASWPNAGDAEREELAQVRLDKMKAKRAIEELALAKVAAERARGRLGGVGRDCGRAEKHGEAFELPPLPDYILK